MMVYAEAENEGLRRMLERFGVELRRCRLRSGLSQESLAAHSGVPQSTISRLERGKTARVPLLKIVLLSESMGLRFPLGFCPHDHGCNWERLDSHGGSAKPPVDLDVAVFRRQMEFD
jgi:transcriptional regulator with XRE-family HTH domain